ncbi:MAG TPA: LD-carboxypeptidase [Caulobacteraceae bacterium]|nr:LD-carboxypeptidase [Caulobacteraceae bacterium]
MAPASRLSEDAPPAVQALVASLYPAGNVEVVFHPQCFFSHGHFAGSEAQRADSFVEVANDPDFDALWYARGGYGSGRLIEAVLPRLTPPAREKAYLGYSDAGAMLSALYGAGFRHAAHGPMTHEIARDGGEAAIARALAWLVRRSPAALEPSVASGGRTIAFNMAILSSLIGTPWLPDLSGHVLMLEEVSEHLYAIDRMFFHLAEAPTIRKVAGIRLGRCSAVPPNDPEFGQTAEEIARYWCERSGIAYLGGADIGHDAGNKVVPFGGL